MKIAEIARDLVIAVIREATPHHGFARMNADQEERIHHGDAEARRSHNR
ncbi:MAG TPA: hypothetical protein VFP71_00775 [Candidatus Angelobacter sp.]|nr:hypothetical protein [Candidatus Angelobacter sp.]